MPFPQAVVHRILCLILAVGALSVASERIARADSPGTPNQIQTFGSGPSTMVVMWTNTADECSDGSCIVFNLRYRLQSSVPDVFASYTYIGGGGAPDDRQLAPTNPLADYPNYVPLGGQGTYEVGGLAPNTSYCFSLRSFNADTTDTNDQFSPWSGDSCTNTLASPASPAGAAAPASAAGPTLRDPTVLGVQPPAPGSSEQAVQTEKQTVSTAPQAGPTKPDLVAVSIIGPTSVSNGINAVYTATIRNDGTATNGNVEVVVSFEDALQAWDSIQQSIGLSCTQGSGYDVNKFTCEGGTLAAGQTATLQFRAHAASTGSGTIRVSLNPTRVVAEDNLSNNVQSLQVTVK